MLIHLIADTETILKRIENKVWDTPFPTHHENVKDFIKRMQVYDEINELKRRFEIYENVTFIESNNYNEIIDYILIDIRFET